ncbi:hypothetical protein C9I89_08375 [Photobacterium lipolyticum]|uniref:Uncharacterized protein n=1 Tax=Photobacterium lipolyticum TaxID=266810 RepID=A0A2T3N0H9_9GAMM|nr:hypothetical protein C9I89_08375 [Photobacterium lipolyticum]
MVLVTLTLRWIAVQSFIIFKRILNILNMVGQGREIAKQNVLLVELFSEVLYMEFGMLHGKVKTVNKSA